MVAKLKFAAPLFLPCNTLQNSLGIKERPQKRPDGRPTGKFIGCNWAPTRWSSWLRRYSRKLHTRASWPLGEEDE